MKKLTYKFNSPQYADLLSHCLIWIEQLEEQKPHDKITFYQLGYLDNVLKKLQRAGMQAKFNNTKQSQISFTIFEIDTIISLANLFNEQNYIITQLQLSLPEEVIELNTKNLKAVEL